MGNAAWCAVGFFTGAAVGCVITCVIAALYLIDEE